MSVRARFEYGCRPRLAERSKRGTDLLSEKLRLLPRREVSAFFDFVKVDQVWVGAARPCLRGSVNLVREQRNAHRELDVRRLLRGRRKDASCAVFPIYPRCGGRGVRQPIQSEVVQHLVFGWRLLRIAAVR